ncbi:MAG TPA: hypothetical protein VGO57_13605 [Verrucomicrobiae bacterium]|jgi:hypothetical protein
MYSPPKIYNKPFLCILAVLVMLYLVAPFISGLLSYRDPEGPLIYPAVYHEVLHTLGRVLVGKGAEKVPLAEERPWFYGLSGKAIDVDKNMRELQQQIDQDERPKTNGVMHNATSED